MKKIFSWRCVFNTSPPWFSSQLPRIAFGQIISYESARIPFSANGIRQFLPQPPRLDLSERYFVRDKKFVIWLRCRRRNPFPNRHVSFFPFSLAFCTSSLPVAYISCSPGIQRIFPWFYWESRVLGVPASLLDWDNRVFKTLSRHIGLW